MTNEMTAEEAVNILKSERDNDIFVLTEYREKLHKALAMAIKALEQQGCVWEIAYERGKVEVLDKIRAEIERKAHSGQWSDATIYGMLKAVAIIDKYREGDTE